MKIIKNLYFIFSVLLFITAILFSAKSTLAKTCYTCTSDSPGGCPTTDICGMTACNQNMDCFIYGEVCGKGCDDIIEN